MKKKNTKTLPVYGISSFLGGKNRSSHFYIQELEKHIREFHMTREPHSHSLYLILFVTHGTGKHTIDFVTYDVKAFSVFFLTPGQVHAWKFSNDAKGFVIFFTSSFYLNFKEKRNLYEFPFFNSLNKSSCLYMTPHREARLIVMCEEMIDEYASNYYCKDEMLCNCLDIMLIRMSRYYQRTALSLKTSTATMKIRQLEFLIEKHFKELKLPREYADLMNMTPNHLNEISKNMLHKTVTELIHERKLLEARRLLSYTDRTIGQIADDLNFNDKSYFIRFFKKHVGKTPERFRELERNMQYIP